MNDDKLKVFLVDDEPLAIKRLSRLLDNSNRVEIVGHSTEPLEALRLIPNLHIDAIFLDIQMPELTGFELLQKLAKYPPVIFTTAFDQFALKAFEVYSVDYLLKPIESERLEKALDKLKKLAESQTRDQKSNIEKILVEFVRERGSEKPIARVASRIGGKVRIIDVSEVSHFFAQDKITFAKSSDGKEYPLDISLNALEETLDKQSFVRVHRSSIINLNFVEQVHGWFSGKIFVRMKNDEKSEIVVARERVKVLKDLLGI